MRLIIFLKYISFVSLAYMICCSTIDLSKYGPEAYIIRGKIQYLEIEGGCWILVTEKGERYELNGDATIPLFKNGSYAELVVRNLEDVATICMSGKNVEILEIINLSN